MKQTLDLPGKVGGELIHVRHLVYMDLIILFSLFNTVGAVMRKIIKFLNQEYLIEL